MRLKTVSWLLLMFSMGPCLADDQTSECRELDIKNSFDIPEIAFPEEFSASVPENGVVRTINFRRHDVFDETTEAADNALFNAANVLHARTTEATVANDLLFKPGDPYDAGLLRESARLLRAQRYFYDARVLPVRICGNQVDVLVITRDVWSLQPSISFSREGGKNRSSLAIRETNLFGWGKRLSVEQESGYERDSIQGIYEDPAVLGSRFRLRLESNDTTDGRENIANLYRPFFSLETRWSAGLRYESGALVEHLYQHGEETSQFVHDRFRAEIGFGASSGLKDGKITRWLLGATVETSEFTPNMLTNAAEPIPGNRHYAYPWIEWRYEAPDYEIRRNFNSIAVTEDVNFGTSAFARLGWSDTGFGAASDSLVIRLGGNWRLLRGRHHLLTLNLHASGYRNTFDDRWENTQGSVNVEYYNFVSEYRTQYGRLYYHAGINMPVDQQVYSDGMTGLRGYPLHFLRGERRSLLQLEQRIFTNWHVFRLLRVGFASFVDAGQSWDERGNSRFLADAGIGLRVASSRAYTDSVVHIDLAFPLREKNGISSYLLSVQIKETF